MIDLSGVLNGGSDFDPEAAKRMLKAALYMVAAQKVDTEQAMGFSDEATDVIVEALMRLAPIGQRHGLSYGYALDLVGALVDGVMANPDGAIAAFSKAAEVAAQKEEARKAAS